MTDIGRPEYPDEQYQIWLTEMAPFLKIGNSLYFAIEKALLIKHKSAIYEKYRLKDWFSEKIDAFQRYPGEVVNSIFYRLILSIDEKVKIGQPVTDEEWRNLRFFAEKHRSCQPFFVSRQEVAQVEPDDISQLLDDLERENDKTDYSHLAEQVKRELDNQQANPNQSA
ncbi:hypothetical protein A3A79_02905 [Candidatus Gottesmanbacteria bacterium RIFCSPLOWO2_01_FULL_43_11b]|uniref:Uncharacterized protein n=1 Tax=Candidatus Gottesmanbacteria bacterium RIFCSPLOWO2_01_FULL_43_11b TaxID=1798392 RepID=A0A1F6AH85_9BACT|nr:MAG: hypothetical protein A3A79_02905 [Candidatus Gottesmanbacteria bacterium RIFCSPLOWO2_01_FULL_43_11b]